MRRLLTPRWIAGHLLALAAVVAFVFFGFWQLDRHGQKQDIKEAAEAAADRLPAEIAAVGDAAAFRLVIAEGTYDVDAEVLVLRSQDLASGYLVLTPLLLDDGSAVLVERGWVPLDYDEPPVPEAVPPGGPVRVTGQLWPAEEGAVPASAPSLMRRIDPAAVAAFTDYEIRSEYLILFDQAPPTTGGVMVLPSRPELSLGPHLGYAGQWFLFALVVLAGYPILLRRTVRSA